MAFKGKRSVMTTYQFLLLVPDEIEHRSKGIGQLEIIIDNPLWKQVCYRHSPVQWSLNTYGKNWEIVHKRLIKKLIFHGYLTNTEILQLQE